MKQKRRLYGDNAEENLEKYLKVIWVDLKNNDCDLQKGPGDEVKLMQMLRNDYNSSRYDKWVRLITYEKIEKEYIEFCMQAFSSRNIKKEFRKGKKQIECSYVCLIEGEYRKVCARIRRKAGWYHFPDEVMIYIEA